MSPLILPFEGKVPRIHASAWIAPNATIIGDVEIGPDASVFYNVVLRGDTNKITIGARSNIQDNSVFHCDADAPATLEEDVTIGHMALVHGAYVEAGSLIGMHAALLSHSRVGAGSLIAGGALVLEGQEIPAGSLAAGVPAKVRRELSKEESAAFIPHAAKYVDYSKKQADISQALNLDDVRFS
ncbi:gamma carbonic anhydrase family protein [Corynebacterium stationis]|uniref:Gamma carbonic anhydrase family protein n=2 Tax=Corynebacterium stationis TaxID=1705 RepID=A0A177IRR0_9CORY|nr:gamma carbonic anhydrase family protein [Corynebacterium stationis]NME89532.1 gamma carbonic anhydrase family protein [Corynebacterium stationis]OAH31583.1 gamma carbonic anhydrase family protein [Corynebacterium stationis]